MTLSTLRIDLAPGIRAVLAVLLCCAGAQAANLLTVTPATVSLTCNTITGPGPAATIVVKPVATLTTGTVTVTTGAAIAGILLTAPASTVLNSTNQSQGITYTVSAAAGCAGATNGTATLRFFAGGVPDATVSVAMDVQATASALVASPVTLTCVRSAGPPIAYTPGPSQTLSVTSAAAGGTPFTVDASTNPAWLGVTSVSGGAAGATGIPFTVSALAPCGNYAVGSKNSASIRLRNAPAPDALIPVTLQILGPSPVSVSPNAPSLSYTKGSGKAAFVDVVLSAPASTTPAFAVDASSLPPWLSVDAATGTVPATLRFTTTSAAETMNLAVYSASVHLQTAGFADLAIPFRLTVANPAATVTVAEGNIRDITWIIGQPLPIPYITLASSGATLPYTIATGGALAPIISSSYAKGFLYSYGTPIPVTFDQSVFAAVQPGSVISGTVTVTWGTPASKTVITLNVTAQPGGATLSAVSPASLPTAAPGQTFTVALSGAGFVAGSDASQRTVVGIAAGGWIQVDSSLSATVINASNIILTITVPAAADAFLPFALNGPGGTINIGVCNPAGSGCTAVTGTAAITIFGKPVVQAVTSASSYLQAAPPALPTVSPYDMISLFGFNFCTAGGSGCRNTVLYAGLDPATLRYPSALSPDGDNASRRLLSVTFQTHATPPVAIANAPLFFATDSQINLLVPSAVTPFIGKTVDIVVNFGASSGAPFTVNVAAASPGIFAVGSNGQGEGAILGSDWTMITSGNEAAMRQTASDSDIVQIFVSGLGAPDGTADNATAGKGGWPTDCATTTSFLTSLNLLISGSFTTLDGAVISSAALNSGRLAPCLKSAGTVASVTIGGQPASVTYAGWVPDSVAGLYQVNVRLPGSAAGPFTLASGAVVSGALTVPAQLPVIVSARGRASQAGVSMWVAPRLKLTAPALAALSGAVGVAWTATGSQVAAGEGTSPYQFAVTGGSLPAGLTLNASTGAISGIPAANSAGNYPVTITATDSAATPLTGTATFVLTIAK